MRLPLSWLKEFLPVTLPPEALAERLTLAGNEVEDISSSSVFDEHFLVGKVETVKSHPNADKLRLVTVDLGSRRQEIVCGAPNVAPGQTVAVVLVGGTLPSGLKIDARPIRGVVSEGMICAEDELGLGKSHGGIMILPAKWPAGTLLGTVYPGQDVVLNLSLTPQRGDLYSVYGLAREIAAITGKKLKPWVIRSAPKKRLTNPRVSIKAASDVRQYALRRLHGVEVKPSPDWLQARLSAAGIRPVNVVVDVTNYVMLETGQPLHAFDANRIDAGTIIVRRAGAQEQLITLDGVTRTLSSDMLVIADARKVLALTGLMGGQGSGVTAHTTDIVLEAAEFDPVRVRTAAAALSLRSESSLRFEKGIDSALTVPALNRAVEMISKLAGGTAEPGIARYGQPRPIQRLSTTLSFINDRLGVTIAPAEVKRILAGLGLAPKVAGRNLTVTVPTWRHDLAIPEDLVDEVGRIVGFGTLPKTLPDASAPPKPPPPLYAAEWRLRDMCARAGWMETLSYPFYGRATLEQWGMKAADHVRLANALSPDQEFLRQSLLPQLFVALEKNRSTTTDAALFEIGHVVLPPWGKDGLPTEESWLAAVAMTTDDAMSAYRRVKGLMELVVTSFGITGVTWKRDGDRVNIVHGKDLIGRAVVQDQGAYRVAGAEISIEGLVDHQRPKPFQPISPFPTVERDVSAWVPDDFTYEKFSAAAQIISPLLRGVQVIDIFSKDGKLSMTFRCELRSMDQTLQEREVDAVMTKIRQSLEHLGGQIR